MKTIITFVILSTGLIYSQTISDSTQIKNKNQEKENVQTQNQEMNKIQNQIGSKEKAQTQVKEKRKGKDVFIDKDGDGICDTRQSGMSFNKMRKRLGAGKQGPSGKGGNQNGNGSGGGN